MDIPSVVTGVAAAGVAYFLYRCARDGVPTVLAWMKAKWTAGKAEATAIKADLDHAHDRIDVVERGLAQVAGDVAKLKAPAPVAIATGNPAAPQFLSVSTLEPAK